MASKGRHPGEAEVAQESARQNVWPYKGLSGPYILGRGGEDAASTITTTNRNDQEERKLTLWF
jgi:hypothetical protein